MPPNGVHKVWGPGCPQKSYEFKRFGGPGSSLNIIDFIRFGALDAPPKNNNKCGMACLRKVVSNQKMYQTHMPATNVGNEQHGM
jgi:hypothetical protein